MFCFYLEFTLDKVPLDAGEQDLAMTWLKPVQDVRYGSHIISHGVQNQLLIDKLRDRDSRDLIVQKGTCFISLEPIFPLICLFFAKGEIQQATIFVRASLKGSRY